MMTRHPVNRFVTMTLASLFASVGGVTAGAQSLDQKAWNALWDRLARVLPANTPTESVHALSVVVPATWATRGDDGLKELQQIASAIPEQTFSIDPSRLRLQLHRAYSNFVLDVSLPPQNAAQQKEFLAASQAYNAAFDEYLKRLDAFMERWERRMKDLQTRGEPVDSQARLEFRTDMGGFFDLVQARLDTASADVQKFAPIANQWVQAVGRIRNELASAASVARGIYSYEGSLATLSAIKDDCTDTGSGWDEVVFNQSVNSQNNRSSNWNVSGGWSGTFVNLNAGGGSSNSSNVVTTANEYVKLRFCNLTYISLRPGAWFDMSFLQAIDAGQIVLKPDSPLVGRRILGQSGVIPRIVKGAVVARRITFEANLSTSNLNEMRSNSRGAGGIRIGPWNIGGGGGSTSFTREYTTANGGYARSTAMAVPVIIAIITEPTQ